MNKQEFLETLRNALVGLPQEELEERLTFYSESIDDRMEEGIPEEEAVTQMGETEEILSQILEETPLAKLAKEKMKPARRLKAWELLLLILGSPVWGSLLIAAIAVVFSVYVSLWAVVISLWSVFGSLAASSLGCILGGIVCAIYTNAFTGLALLGTALVLAGLSIFSFFGCKGVTKGFLLLTKKAVFLTKKHFMKKGEAK